jgi:RimJ/RimL family protein N-acetyltransferase
MLRRATDGEFPAVAALIAAYPMQLLAQSEGWLREIAAEDGGAVMIWDRGGIDGVAVLHWAYPRVVYLMNLGLARPGQGEGRAFLSAVQAHVFGSMGAHRMFCDIAFDNAPALAAFAKAGFVQEGTMRECWDRGAGVWVDCHAYGMLAREWRATA